MKKKQITYKARTLNAVYQPTCDKDFLLEKKVKVQAPQFTESTYDAGFEVLRQLGTTAYAVYMAILSYRNTKTNDCHPSIKRISQDFNLSERTIKDNIDKLYDNGFLKINSGHKDVANNYYFPFEFFFDAWEEDYNQVNAERRKNGITDKRKTKSEILQENEELRRQIKELQKKASSPAFDNNDEDDDIVDEIPF